MIQTKEQKSQRAKERREQRRKEGLCPECGRANDRFPKWLCSVCLELHNQRSTEWRRNKLADQTCPQCGGELDRDGWCCTACYGKIGDHMRELHRRKKEGDTE